jgi:hypothetical protein
MIQGSKVILTPDAILSKISAFDVFMMYMPHKLACE